MSVIAHSMHLDNICRTCLSKEQNMKSVFDTDCSLGETHQLFQMLIACTSVQVQEGDGLPAQICISCIENIARSFSFKKRCEDSDSTLREVLRKSTITGEPLIELKPSTNIALYSPQVHAVNRDMFDIKMEFEESETNSNDLISSTQYSHCEKNYNKMINNVDDLQSQPIIHYTNNLDTKPIIINDNLVHEQNDCDTNNLNVNNKKGICPLPDESKQPSYACKECTACFQLENDLKSHSRTHRQLTNHKCTLCGQEFTNAIALGRHMKVHNVKPHLCNQCGKGFKSPSLLRIHSTSHTGEKRFVCELCGKRFSQSFTLTEHMRAHANERNFICATCGKGFVRRSNLISHQKTHTGLKTRTCNICGKQMWDAGTLTIHMKTHTGVKDHVCRCCGRGFTTSSHLNVHERTHTGEKPFVCDVCGKGFVSSSTLKKHMRMHMRNNKKPYQCHLCPRAFLRSEEQRVHIERHSKERTHICDYCKKGFYQASTLKAHLRIHTGEKPYTCKICNKSFGQVASLSFHLKRH